MSTEEIKADEARHAEQLRLSYDAERGIIVEGDLGGRDDECDRHERPALAWKNIEDKSRRRKIIDELSARAIAYKQTGRHQGGNRNKLTRILVMPGGAIYVGLREAEKGLGLSTATICQVLRGKDCRTLRLRGIRLQRV